MNALPPPPLTAHADGFGARRVTFEEDSLFLEVRDSIMGTYQPVDEIFWEEVEEVYLWRSPDWTSVAVGVTFAIVATSGAWALLGAFVGWPLGTAVALALALLLVGLSILVGVRVPRRNVRVVARGREIRFFTTDQHVTRALLRRLGLEGAGY